MTASDCEHSRPAHTIPASTDSGAAHGSTRERETLADRLARQLIEDPAQLMLAEGTGAFQVALSERVRSVIEDVYADCGDSDPGVLSSNIAQRLAWDLPSAVLAVADLRDERLAAVPCPHGAPGKVTGCTGCSAEAAEVWRSNLSYAATALESSADNGDRYSARLIREHLAATATVSCAHEGEGQQPSDDAAELIAQARRLPDEFRAVQLSETQYLEDQALAELDAVGYAAVHTAQRLADALAARTSAPAADALTNQRLAAAAKAIHEVECGCPFDGEHTDADLERRDRIARAVLTMKEGSR